MVQCSRCRSQVDETTRKTCPTCLTPLPSTLPASTSSNSLPAAPASNAIPLAAPKAQPVPPSHNANYGAVPMPGYAPPMPQGRRHPHRPLTRRPCPTMAMRRRPVPARRSYSASQPPDSQDMARPCTPAHLSSRGDTRPPRIRAGRRCPRLCLPNSPGLPAVRLSAERFPGGAFALSFPPDLPRPLLGDAHASGSGGNPRLYAIVHGRQYVCPGNACVYRACLHAACRTHSRPIRALHIRRRCPPIKAIRPLPWAVHMVTANRVLGRPLSRNPTLRRRCRPHPSAPALISAGRE